MGMYAKLMSRITESSLMEEAIPVRYCFMMLLAIADPKGYVVGTDIAIARRMNLPVEEFRSCLAELMKPDPNSNSKEEEGRRVIESDCERGYFLVNYTKYRDTRDEEHRREYMREYMRNRRNPNGVANVNNGKQAKPQLANAEAEVEAEVEAKEKGEAKADESFTEFWQAYPRRVGKGNAEAAWKKHGCAKLLPQILTAVRACKISEDWTKDGGQYIPHPARWLNRRGWEDELLPRGNGLHPGRQENLKAKNVERY